MMRSEGRWVPAITGIAAPEGRLICGSAQNVFASVSLGRPDIRNVALMNQHRSPEFAPHDAPLREDVRRLGAQVGNMLAEQISPAFLKEVERIRMAAIERREEDAPLDLLAGLLTGLDTGHAESLARAFAAYFQVVNVAERVHR